MINKDLKPLAVVGIALLLSACATMTPEECAVADWERIGELDARAGQGLDYFARRASDCTEAGYAVDRDAWMRGWDLGITWFCTSSNGFRKGMEGYRYENICPGHMEDEFLSGYKPGYSIHRAEAQIEQTESDIERTEQRLDRLRKEQPRDREEIERTRNRLATLNDRLRREELELARLKGVAQGQGFPVSY